MCTDMPPKYDMKWVWLIYVTMVATVVTGIPTQHTVQSMPQQQDNTAALCPNSQFTCTDGLCIDQSKVCDFTSDCSDGIDEKGCPLTCNFDTDFCGWKNTHPDKLNWVRGSGATTTNIRSMAPQYDSTSSRNGYYVFIWDQTGGQAGENHAVLTSPTYSSASAQCKVKFSLFIDGAVGTLRLTVTQGGEKGILWQDNGDRGSYWQSTTVGLGRRTTRFALVFETDTVGYDGAIAIDQLQFQDCGRPQPQSSCFSSIQFTCANKACVSLSRKCDITYDCEDNSDELDPSCATYKRFNFETDFGDLSQGSDGVDDDFDWTRWNGSTPSPYTGPDSDHTTGLSIGHYLYMRAQNHTFNQKTWLLTKIFSPTVGKNCHMRFYHYMYGNYVNQLNIYSRIYSSGEPTLLGSVVGDHGPIWQQADISLSSSNSFQVIIEAKVGDNYRGDIAIDDVSFTPDCQYSGQALPTPPDVTSTSTLTPPTAAAHSCNLTFQCNCRSTGKCINKSQKCDFWTDCSDGSDEDNCVSATTNFEWGAMGNWQVNQSQSSSDMTYSWQVTQASSSSGDQYTPYTDHTNTSTTSGWFLWADSSPGNYGDTAVLYTPPIGQTGPHCRLKFFYYMSGSGIALEVFRKDGQKMSQLGEWFGASGTLWHQANIFLGFDKNFQIVMQAKRRGTYEGDISLDDIYFLNCQPPRPIPGGCDSSMFTCTNGYCIDYSKRCNYDNDCGDDSDEVKSQCDSTYPGRCDFEQSICSSWSQEIGDNFNWTRNQGQTLTVGSGPSVDHTIRNLHGHYLYIEASAPRRPGDKARLASFAIKGSSRNCTVRLWYNMNGADVGSLTIYKRFNYTASGLAPVLSFSLNTGDIWTETHTTLDDKGGIGDFKVVIGATRGKGYQGDIAIDDVSLTPGCESGGIIPGQPAGHSTTLISLTPCGKNQRTCDNGTCTFENGWCGWNNAKGDVLDWTSHQSTTTSINTGPANDHTLGNHNGHYLYIETSGYLHKGDSAILESSDFSLSGLNCELTFWYHMYGRDIGSLSVLVRTAQSGNLSLWSKSGNQTYAWHRGSVFLGSRRNFAILFEATRGDGYQGDIAIDDISFSNCNIVLATPGTTASSQSTTLMVHTTPADFRQAIQLQCLPQGWAVTMDFTKLSSRPGNVTHIFMGTETCTGSVQGDLLVLNRTYDQCNTQAQVTGGKITFTNNLLYGEPDLNHAIKDIGWDYKMQCSHSLYANGTVQIVQTMNATNQGSSTGQISESLIDISVFKDAKFRDPLQGIMAPSSPVYVQVISHTPPDVVMVLDSCETSVASPNSSQQKSITLVEKHVEQTTNILVVRSQLARFKFDMFHIPSVKDGISITCDVHFCDQADLSPSCEQRCQLNPAVIG